MVTRQILLLLGITQIGSALTTVTTFISIEAAFQKVDVLLAMLSLRTLSFILFSALSARIIQGLGIRRALYFSQLLGLIVLLPTSYGLIFSNALSLGLGIMLSGLPSVLLNVSTGSAIKLLSDSAVEFRKASSSRDLITGGCLLISGLLSPVIVTTLGIIFALGFDFFTFIVALTFLRFIKLEDQQLTVESKPNYRLMKTPVFMIFFFLSGAALAVVALVPLISGSKSLFSFLPISDFIKQSAWVIEGAVALSAGIAYRQISKSPKIFRLMPITVITSIPLLLLWFSPTPVIALVVVPSVALLCQIAFMYERDTLILTATSKTDVLTLTSLAVSTRAFWYSASPFIVAYVYSSSMIYPLIALLAFQITAALMSVKLRGTYANPNKV